MPGLHFDPLSAFVIFMIIVTYFIVPGAFTYCHYAATGYEISSDKPHFSILSAVILIKVTNGVKCGCDRRLRKRLDGRRSIMFLSLYPSI